MRDDLRPAFAPMRLVAVCVLALVALVALPAVAQAGQHKRTVLAQCTDSALVRPLLGAPSCQTAPVRCESNFDHCWWRAEVAAQALTGLGMSAARVELTQGQYQPGAIATCTGPAEGCTAITDTNFPPVGSTWYAKCTWEGMSLNVFARVDCLLMDAGAT